MSRLKTTNKSLNEKNKSILGHKLRKTISVWCPNVGNNRHKGSTKVLGVFIV